MNLLAWIGSIAELVREIVRKIWPEADEKEKLLRFKTKEQFREFDRRIEKRLQKEREEREDLSGKDLR